MSMFMEWVLFLTGLLIVAAVAGIELFPVAA